MHHVVVVGGGFAGLNVVRGLAGVPAQVTLVDRRNFHVFQPLLYQVATGALSPANIAAPLRAVVSRQRNCTVILGEVADVDVPGRRLILKDGGEQSWDTLVVAAGARHHYFGKESWEAFAPGLKTIEDATEIRKRVLLAFEMAERAEDPKERAEWLTFGVVGGGATGVELAGALAEISRHTLRKDFRRIRPEAARILLFEASEHVLNGFTPDLWAHAGRSLRRLGVELRTGAHVKDIGADHVTVEAGGAVETIRLRTMLWAAGVKASPLGAALARSGGAALDRAGRVTVGGDLSVPGHPEVFVLGDMAACAGKDGRQLPGVAPVAMQQGTYAARVIRARLLGRAAPKPFAYGDRGSMATIGRNAAVADLGFVRYGGYLAWLSWLFLHLMFLVQFQNRILVFLQWTWSYLTWNRAARLITEPWRPMDAGQGPESKEGKSAAGRR